MKKFICRKPIKFGKDYIIGEEIPAEEISENRVPALLKYGVIDVVEAPEAPDDPEATEAPEAPDDPEATEAPEVPEKTDDKPVQATGRKKAAK